MIFHRQIRSDCFHFLHNFPNPTIYKLPAANVNDRYCRCSKANSCGKIPHWRDSVMVDQRENTREHLASTVSWLFELAEFSPVISCSTAQACVINTLHSYSVLLFLLFFSHFQFLFVSFFRVYATSWKLGGVLLQLNTQLEHTSDGVGEKYPQHFLASPACSWAKERRRSVQEERNFRSRSWVLICSQVIGRPLWLIRSVRQKSLK